MREAIIGTLLFAALLLCGAAVADDAKTTPTDAAVKVGVAKVVSPAPVTPAVPAAASLDPVDTGKSMYQAFKDGDYREGVALAIMLLVFLGRRFTMLLSEKIPAKALPYIVAGLAFLASIPTGLTGADFAWSKFIWHSIIAGAEAIALWTMLGKLLLPKLFKMKLPAKTTG